ncbi:MAG: T9SS type A sorting domain-containing protein [Gracilimonas sp.]|uniref:WD40/YVTN/BNR-like repeat-containing protein n=1 Tax=Gracilimonas sp. TaxID=1974203 RepID=UPI001B06225A|nr:T9SS type A sorting domain-containing protein [Gracilimonas sp.]MBO6584769.1 T9SS type A sorting domain-containing protein [Gracilimonas sp.]MBO6615960.1 T9SS type A sorting domain-containing protein [Gracilimonas sp.]
MVFRKICFFTVIYFVFFSFDAKSQWSKFEGLNDNEVRAIAIQDENIFVGVYSNENIFMSEDGGETWTLFNEGITPVPVLDILLKDPDIFISTEGSGVYRMSDSANTWTKVHNIGYKLLLKDDDVFTGSNHGVYRSSDNGNSWTQADSGLSRPPNTNVQSFTYLGDSIFVGTWGDGVFFSANNGDYWQQINDGLNTLFVWSFATMDSTIFVGTLGGVYRRELTGTNWQEVNEGLSNNKIHDLTVNEGNLFAGTDQGVFYTTNKGEDWQSSNIGLPDTTVWSLETDNDFIYAGTEIGLFKRPLSDIITSIKVDKNDIPNELTLNQNYPNPFNPSTTISFDIPYSAFVTLKVFDITGREVRTLISERKISGEHKVVWNAQELSSGIYFYQIKTEFFNKTKKMILLK